ncbi:MAG TPA: isoprenylcysteine carboxylmethyltransferase family protein [Candidatus Dormibacteraeota bacterium]|jgi:protein-S-isoprenylcysteine O-methyltransferase Ste14
MAQAVAIPARRGDLERRVDDIRFLVFGRSLPAVLFALLGYRVLLNLLSQVRALPAHAGPGNVLAGPLTTGVYLLFCVIPVGIYLVRPRPRARDGRVVARAAGLVGTTMLLVVGAFSSPVLFTPPLLVRAATVPLTLGAFVLGVYGLLYLRRNLSIIPEARRLVTGGPYRLIRHPLYAAEILAASALVIARPGLWATLALAPFIAVQMLRATFEEGLLARAFPEYKPYAARTRRLIPLLW